ncbi:MAG TPA: ABC transporter permease [Bauldia sp.]|nr:ABC transporter permease [Bauldia sp.]
MLRHLYLLRSSWPRLLELLYWPLVQMVMWGFLQTYLNQHSGFIAAAGGTLIGAILLWDVLVRGQLGLSVSFLEEMWSRNMANLLISPMRSGEFLVALMAMSLLRLLVSLVPVTLLAIWFFGFNLWSLGFGLAAFFANLLLCGWAVGIVVSGLILRNGLGAEGLAWTLMFLLLPLCAVFYPVAVLPAFLQPVAWALPPTYVFEGMRAILFDHTFRADLMVEALIINAGLILVSVFVFLRLLDSARRIGSLMAIGE